MHACLSWERRTQSSTVVAKDQMFHSFPREQRHTPMPEYHRCSTVQWGTPTCILSPLRRGEETWISFRCCGSAPTLKLTNYVSFSLCCIKLGELCRETCFLMSFFLINSHYLEVHSIRFLQIYTYCRLFLMHSKCGWVGVLFLNWTVLRQMPNIHWKSWSIVLCVSVTWDES